MAQGTVSVFEEFIRDVGEEDHNLNGDTHKIALYTTTMATDTAAPVYTTTNECSGTNYSAAGETANITYAEAGGTGTLALGTAVTWSADASGPDDVRFARVYSDSAAAKEAIAEIDMRAGGTTALDLGDGDITIGTGTILTIAKA